jgi:ribosomal protein L11 methyltransferase
MSWLELHVITSAEQAAQLSDQLTLLGAQAVTLQDAGDQPIYEPSPSTPRIWEETIVVGLFDTEQVMAPILTYLEQQQAEGLLKHFKLIEIADEDWVRRSLDQFKPLCFGKRLWICPSWCVPPDPAAVNIILDPGLAFGTGTHPTTALCLEWLDEHISAEQWVIDYGCGSGVLGLAALKLGAKQVLAIDNDPQALEATQRNAEQNKIYPPDLVVALPGDIPAGKADLMIANILAKPLIELAPLFGKLCKSGGKILLSGILREQVKEIKEVYEAAFELQPIVFKEEWVRVVGVRR